MAEEGSLAAQRRGFFGEACKISLRPGVSARASCSIIHLVVLHLKNNRTDVILESGIAPVDPQARLLIADFWPLRERCSRKIGLAVTNVSLTTFSAISDFIR
jgi:hypothetical protein